MRTNLVLASLIALVATTCATGCSESDGVFLRDNVLYVRGEITEETAREFEKKFSGDISAIQITSGGGETTAALNIAEKIERAGIPVTADLICFSACASYVWMAGSERVVMPDTIVALHHGASPFLTLYEQLSAQFSAPKASKELIANAQKEEELYTKLGVEMSLLHLGNYVRGLRCVRLGTRQDGSTSLLPEFDAAGYIPTRAVFASYGVEVEGPLPNAAPDLSGAIDRMGGETAIPFLVMTDSRDAGLNLDEIKARTPYGKLKLCENE